MPVQTLSLHAQIFHLVTNLVQVEVALLDFVNSLSAGRASASRQATDTSCTYMSLFDRVFGYSILFISYMYR